MTRVVARIHTTPIWVLLLLSCSTWLTTQQDQLLSESNKADFVNFFDSVDTDRDGQIEVGDP